MDFLEQDLETIIYEAPQHLLRERGLDCLSYDKIYQQVPLLDYGRADIITVNKGTRPCSDQYRRAFNIVIYELKLNKIDINTMLQVSGYWKAATIIAKSIKGRYNLKNTCFTFEVVMVGKSIETSGNFCLMADLLPSVSMFTYSYGFDGITFTRKSNYGLSGCDLTDKAIEFAEDWIEYESLDRYMKRIPVLTEDDRESMPF